MDGRGQRLYLLNRREPELFSFPESAPDERRLIGTGTTRQQGVKVRRSKIKANVASRAPRCTAAQVVIVDTPQRWFLITFKYNMTCVAIVYARLFFFICYFFFMKVELLFKAVSFIIFC